MSKIGNAITTMNRIQELASRDRWVNSIHPLVKFLLTIFYIGIVVSCGKYDVFRVMGFIVYPLVMFPLADLSVKGCIRRIWIVLPFVCLIGAFNPILDRSTILIAGTAGAPDAVVISAGWFSMAALIVKGVLTVLAGYLLIATTGIEEICYALQLLCVPKVLITQVLLTYRYISLLLQEAERVTQAYALRAPNQKGVHFKVWGSLVGQMLLRNIDRADAVYESMLLRGYHGSFRYEKKATSTENAVLYGAIWVLVFLLLRRFPIIYLLGGLFV